MNETLFYVAERYPLCLVESTERQQFKIKFVQLATKKGIEVKINSEEMVNPEVECWFTISLEYPWTKKNSVNDSDVIVTDGQEFFLCRRDLGKSKFIFNKHSQKRLLEGISKFTERLLNETVHSKHRGQTQAD